MRESRLAAIAARQHSAFTRAQALDAGFSAATIDRMVQRGRWIRRHRGVLVDAAARRSPQQDAIAACLACGPGAMISYRSAALIHGLDVPQGSVPEVTVPIGRERSTSGIRVYRSRWVGAEERATFGGVLVTRPTRTLVDCGAIFGTDLIEVMLDAFWRRGSLDPDALSAYLSLPKCATRPGTADLRRLVAERMGTAAPGSDLEVLYLRILRRYAIPRPETQFPVMTRRGLRYVDCAYPEKLVAIELDGFEWHAGSRAAHDREKARQNDIERLGWTFRRFTWTQLVYGPLDVAATTADALSLVPARWKPAPSNGRSRAPDGHSRHRHEDRKDASPRR